MRGGSSIAREVGLVFGSGLVVYGLSLSPNLAEAHDSVRYLNAIDAGESLFHAHHLLFAPLAYAWLGLCRALGVAVDSVFVVGALDAIAGAVGLAAFYALLRARAGLPARFAAVATALPAFSFGYWFYSTSVEVYLVPLAFLLICLYVLSGGCLEEGPADARATSRYRSVGVAHALAVLFHQIHVLFGVAVLAAIWWECRGDLREARRRTLAHASTAVPIVALAYAGVMFGVEGVGSAGEALRFLSGYAASGDYWYPLSVDTLARAAVGAARSLVGGHFVLALPVGDRVVAALEGQGLADEIFLVRDLSTSLAWTLLALSALFAVGFAFVATRALRTLLRAGVPGDPADLVARLCLVAIAPYALFFLFWVPHNVEFWIPQSTWLWAALAIGWWKGSPRPARARTLGALAVGLGLVNFAGSIDGLRDARNDYYRALVAPYARETGPADLVLFGRSWILEAYAQRFGRADVTSLERIHRAHPGPELAGAVRAEIRHVTERGGRVFVAADAVRPPAGALWLASESDARELFAPYRDRWVRVEGALGPHWVIGPDAPETPAPTSTGPNSRVVEPGGVVQTGERR